MIKYSCLISFLAITYLGYSQSDVVVGSTYNFSIQRKNDHGDAFLLHNAQYYSGYDELSWITTHGSFGARGVRFSYTSGIHFYADNRSTTATNTFSPTTRFFISNNGRLGIGNTNPNTKLDLNGDFQLYPAGDQGVSGALKLRFLPGTSATLIEANSDYVWANHDIILNAAHASAGNQNQLVVHRSGNVGVGTNAPASRLQVSSSNAVDRIAIQGTLPNSNMGFMIMNPDGTERWSLANVNDRDYLQFYRSGYGNVMVLRDNGRVGIGTSSPSEMLTVNGTIYGKEVRVDLSVPAPDYVFEDTYDLPSLKDVKEFISTNKHLTEVPSASQMQHDGIEVGEMNMLLLKKIEELTLYLIQQQNEIELLKSDLTMFRENYNARSRRDKMYGKSETH